MHPLFVILIIVLLAGIAVGLVLQHRLYSRLTTEHSNALQHLDESSDGIMAFQRYLWKRQYLGLGDAALTRRADSLRRYWTICFLFFLSVLAALIVAVAI
ncbi:MAG TPA: hypothetical protein P5205_18040 [Candidatus Paceibacterota bacterium]|nr:hypothetical protein [Verrucomicrobiota bacterium]HSA12265.1 hypothetical protein [Candidatus Paceibacterota bacterium]